jgi:hypothetical protein
MPTPYQSLESMLELIEEPNRSACITIFQDNENLFKTAQGSMFNHHTWVGGYYDHIQEVMNIAIVLYTTLNSLRPLPFSLSDLLLVLYLHDIEKPWRYDVGYDGKLENKPHMDNPEKQHIFREKKLKEYGILLTEDQKNGLRYVEGEGKDYSGKHRAMEPLASLAHTCDVTSARVYFDYPLTDNDTWVGAERIKE